MSGPESLREGYEGKGKLVLMMGWAREGGELDAQVKLSTDSPCLTKVTITGAILVAGVYG